MPPAFVWDALGLPTRQSSQEVGGNTRARPTAMNQDQPVPQLSFSLLPSCKLWATEETQGRQRGDGKKEMRSEAKETALT